MTTRDQEEQDMRIDQMTVNIEKMRQDIDASQRQFALENRKFTLQIVATIAGTAAATATVMGLILHLLGKI